MCGIVGLFLKNPALQSKLGAHVETMLIGMSERGPDSAGIAVYHSPVAKGRSKLTLFNADESYPWRKLAGDLGAAPAPAISTSCSAIPSAACWRSSPTSSPSARIRTSSRSSSTRASSSCS
jgi:hypothetical protein